MLHACVRIFDVTGNVEKILGTKRGLNENEQVERDDGNEWTRAVEGVVWSPRPIFSLCPDDGIQAFAGSSALCTDKFLMCGVLNKIYL